MVTEFRQPVNFIIKYGIIVIKCKYKRVKAICRHSQIFSALFVKKQQKKGIGFILVLKVIPNDKEWCPSE